MASGVAVVVRPVSRPTRRPTPRRRPAARRRPAPRRRVRRAGRQQVPGWVIAAGGLALLLLGTRGVTATAAALAPAPAAAAALACVAGGGQSVVGFTASQLAHAAAIVAAGREMGVPERGQVIAVATAMQESGLRMYANDTVPASLALPHEAVGSDHDSTGLFQQRTAGWGTLAQRMDAAGSARLFYARLLALPRWDALPLTVAAQRVQVSAHPDRYAKWEDEAARVVAAVASGITCTDTRS